MATESTPPPSFVKQAMRNMVRKGSKSLFHFGLTAMGFLGFITLVAWLGRPTLPGRHGARPRAGSGGVWRWNPPTAPTCSMRRPGSSSLKRWLNSFCRDKSLDCPSLVRAAEELSLGLRFTDDANIADLNSAWRQKTGPTDVLSFAALDDAGDWMEGPASNWETSSFLLKRPGVRPMSRATACSGNCAGW
jgi:hypothetical protein